MSIFKLYAKQLISFSDSLRYAKFVFLSLSRITCCLGVYSMLLQRIRAMQLVKTRTLERNFSSKTGAVSQVVSSLSFLPLASFLGKMGKLCVLYSTFENSLFYFISFFFLSFFANIFFLSSSIRSKLKRYSL